MDIVALIESMRVRERVTKKAAQFFGFSRFSNLASCFFLIINVGSKLIVAPL